MASSELTPPTGLGLFARPATATDPHPTAIAINLTLRATAPQVDRPWAWRVSTPLRHPGPDGLARHVPEVERLAKLGRAAVAAVPSAVFAAAVTTAGRRTWLVYAAAGEPVAVQLDADYPAAVAVEHDPAWGGYLSLYPTEAELAEVARQQVETAAVATARSATHAMFRSLRSAGVDLTRPTAIRYQLDVSAAAPLIARAAAEGLRVELGSTLGLVRDDLPNLPLILRTERWLIREAARAGGRYLGWAAM